MATKYRTMQEFSDTSHRLAGEALTKQFGQPRADSSSPPTQMPSPSSALAKLPIERQKLIEQGTTAMQKAEDDAWDQALAQPPPPMNPAQTPPAAQ